MSTLFEVAEYVSLGPGFLLGFVDRAVWERWGCRRFPDEPFGVGLVGGFGMAARRCWIASARTVMHCNRGVASDTRWLP